MYDRDAQTIFVCRQNIERYERLLKTHLTDLERDYIQKRVAEDKQTLRSAGAEMPSRIDGDVKILYRVARVIIAGLFSSFLDFLLPNFTLVDLFGIV